MKRLHFHYHMDIAFSEPVCNHTYTLKCIPKDTANQRITRCSLVVSPANPVRRGQDSFSNAMAYGNVAEPHHMFQVDVEGEALTGVDIDVPERGNMDLAVFKYHTPLTRPGDRIFELLNRCKTDPIAPAGEDCAEKIVNSYMHAVSANMQYEKGRTDIATTAEEALALGKGVCQDYAHILLAMCRESNIPARYVVGMFLGEGESHAWVEIFDGKRWVGFDPTNNVPVGDTYIRISHGRDYRDCSINRGVFTGTAKQCQKILVEVTECM